MENSNNNSETANQEFLVFTYNEAFADCGDFVVM